MRVNCRCLAHTLAEVSSVVPTFVMCTPRLPQLPHLVRGARVVLGCETEAQAAQLLQTGARQVFVGQAALDDPLLLTRLLQRFGQGRVGLHLPVRRQPVNWSFETTSNADFKVVTPSLCEPVWEVLRSDGSATAVRAKTLLQAAVGQGVDDLLLRVDMADDTDLNLCADMVETFARRLWVAPLTVNTPQALPWVDWVEFGQVTQLALPAKLYAQRNKLLTRPAPTPQEPTQLVAG